ncbi:MAG: hypothetical protein IKF47_03035 [Bacilli bacterium]|nr:hypothetical protein [Bacilli bacterium]
MYQYNRKREIIKNTIYIIFILLLAVIPTYYIYNKFQGDGDISVNGASLDVTYHEKNGAKVSLTKVTPVTDSVGLSSNAYNITIKNNLTEKVNYKVLIEDDLDSIKNDACEEFLIPKEFIKISIKTDKMPNKIYTLTELENNELLIDTMEALEKKNISIRLWVAQYSNIPTGSKMHYHGILKVLEEND